MSVSQSNTWNVIEQTKYCIRQIPILSYIQFLSSNPLSALQNYHYLKL